MRYCDAFIIINCLFNPLATANEAFSKILNLKTAKNSMYNLSVHLLKTCDFKFKTIIIYNNISDQDTFSAFAEIQPPTSVSLLSNVIEWQQAARFRVVDVNVDAVMIVIDVQSTWILMKDLFRIWPFNRDCIVFIYLVPSFDCADYQSILQLIMRFYFSAAYFICLMDGRSPHVYTHDPYGDTEPQHWNKISQEFLWGKNWTFYERSYYKDMNELCPGFLFERTDPTNKIFPVLGVRSDKVNKEYNGTEEVLVNAEAVEPYLIPNCSRKVQNLKRLLKMKFKYHIIMPPNHAETLKYAYNLSSIDAFIFPRFSFSRDHWWSSFYPVRVGSYAIISHNRGIMTPLEKIAKFYGIWTLLSLILMLSMTFIVIWLKTNKIRLAAFDIIRLIINTGIVVPINTSTLKIFFSTVFLYFLIIHATFSGHLAKFLTKIDYKSNIETLEDLKDSKIERLYYFGYRFDENKEFDVLRRKLEWIRKSDQCSQIKNQKNSACIAPLANILLTRVEMNDTNNTYYISKNSFGLSLISDIYKAGFPCYEKFNRAIVYLFDTDIDSHFSETLEQTDLMKCEKQFSATLADHRKIKISDLHFAIVLLIVGNCAGFLCFLCEIASNIVNNKLKNRRKYGYNTVKSYRPR